MERTRLWISASCDAFAPLGLILGGLTGTWGFVALVALLLLGGGCMSPADKPLPPPVIQPDDDNETDQADELSLKMMADVSLLGTLHETLGDRGSVTINPEKPIIIRKPSATITIRPGSSLNYDLTATGGTVLFSEPLPAVSAKVWGVRVTPSLRQLDLRPDNTGTAHVESGPLKLSREFSLGWTEVKATGEAAAAGELPVVRVYSADWCGPCQPMMAAFNSAKELPYRVEIIKDNTAEFPAWVTALPTLHWETPGGWRQMTGWPGLVEFTARWRASYK